MQVLYGYYYLHHNANNYKGPDEAMSYAVDKSDITGTFYKNGLFIDELIQKFELYHNRFYMYSVTGNSFAWDADEHIWSANNTPIAIPNNQSISVEFNFPLLFPNEFTTCFLGQMVERSDIAPSDDFIYDQGYDSGYNVGYIEGVAITNDANATTGDILAGKSAYVKGKKVQGSIPQLFYHNFNRTYTVDDGVITQKMHPLRDGFVSTPNNIGTSIELNELDPNFTAYNIKKGINIFGISGRYDGFDDGRKHCAPFQFQAKHYPSGGLYDINIYNDTYVEPYTNAQIPCAFSDFVEIRSIDSSSYLLLFDIINKNLCAEVEISMVIECTYPDGATDDFNDVYTLAPGEELSLEFEASENQDSYSWEYYPVLASFNVIEE